MSVEKKIKKNAFSINDKVIAIIGSTGILGREYVEHLSSLGAIVVVGDIKLDICQKLCTVLNNKGLKTYPLEIDNTNEESINLFFDRILKKFKKLDVLINNAQIKPEGFYSKFENYNKKTLTEVIDGNLVGVVLACKQACKIFLSQKDSGVIINISSVYGISAPDQRIYKDAKNLYYPNEKFTSPVSYAISKAGVIQLTKYLASYYRETNIRVNCLTPGGVYDSHDDSFVKNYSSKTTLGRMAEKNEYNSAIQFLCSDASSYMSGANLVIDGGWTVG